MPNFKHEIVANAHELKLRIQKEIMERQQYLKDTDDIGFASWVVACAVLKDYEENNLHPKNKFLDYLKTKLNI